MKNGIRLHRLKVGMSKAELSRRTGVAPQQLGRLENGKRKLTKEWAAKIAPALRCTVQELMFPETARVDLDKYSAIYDLLAGERPDLGPALSLSRDLYRRLVPGDGDATLQVMFVDTEDLSNTAQRGEALIVDLEDNVPDRPGIYAVRIQGRPQWRRLAPLISGKIRVSSDDPSVGDEVVSPSDLKVLGRAQLKIATI